MPKLPSAGAARGGIRRKLWAFVEVRQRGATSSSAIRTAGVGQSFHKDGTFPPLLLAKDARDIEISARGCGCSGIALGLE